jgi:hypothetical protein
MTTQRRGPVRVVTTGRFPLPRPTSKMPYVDLRYIGATLNDIDAALARDDDEGLEIALNRACSVLDRVLAEDELWDTFKREHRGLTRDEWRRFYEARKDIEQLWGPSTQNLVKALRGLDDPSETAQDFLDRSRPYQQNGGKASPDLLLREIRPRLTELRDLMEDLRTEWKQRVLTEEARTSLRQKIRTALRRVASVLVNIAVAAAFTVRGVAVATPRLVDAVSPIAEHVGTAMPALVAVAIASAEVGAAIIVTKEAVGLIRQLPLAANTARVVGSASELAAPSSATAATPRPAVPPAAATPGPAAAGRPAAAAGRPAVPPAAAAGRPAAAAGRPAVPPAAATPGPAAAGRPAAAAGRPAAATPRPAGGSRTVRPAVRPVRRSPAGGSPATRGAGGPPATLSATENGGVSPTMGGRRPASMDDKPHVLPGSAGPPAAHIGAVPSVPSMDDKPHVLPGSPGYPAAHIGAVPSVPSMDDKPHVLPAPTFAERLEKHMQEFDSGTRQLGGSPRDIDPPSHGIASPF